MQILEKGATQGSFKGNIIFKKPYCQEQGAFSRKRAKILSKEEVAGRPGEHREQLQEERSSQRKSWIWCVHSPSKGEHLRNPQKYFREKEWTLGICHTQRAPNIRLHLPLSMGNFFFYASFASSRTNSGCDSWQPTGEVMLRRTEQGREVATLSSSPLILNFMCQFGGTKGCPDSWYTLFQAVSVMLFPKEIISIWIRLSEDHSYQCMGHQPSVEGLNHSAKSQSGARGEGGDRGCDGWMASPTQWTWVSVNSGRRRGKGPCD